MTLYHKPFRVPTEIVGTLEEKGGVFEHHPEESAVEIRPFGEAGVRYTPVSYPEAETFKRELHFLGDLDMHRDTTISYFNERRIR